jgi:hypothetical protein
MVYFMSRGILSAFIILSLACNLSTANVFAQIYPYIASARGSFNLNTGNVSYETELPSVLSILETNDCPGELAMYVHGVWATQEEAQEQAERVFLSLQRSDYDIPLIGFSWDSDTAFSLDDTTISQQGWNIAKGIANANGPILADSIREFKEVCPNDKLRIIAHSLGSRLTLSAIQNLYETNYTDVSKRITSVHLLGAAVDNEQVSMNHDQCTLNIPHLGCSGKAIKTVVENFYNLYNPEDNMLAPEEVSIDITPLNSFDQYYPFLFIVSYPSPYQSTENDDPLGAYAISKTINVPDNYKEQNVLSKVEDEQDSDQRNGCDLRVNLKHFGYPFGNLYHCTILKNGDNHFGYLGYRNVQDPQTVSSSGAIDFVISDWRNANS